MRSLILPAILLLAVVLPSTPSAVGAAPDPCALATRMASCPVLPADAPGPAKCAQAASMSLARGPDVEGTTAACAPKPTWPWSPLPYGWVVTITYTPNSACYPCGTTVSHAPGWTCSGVSGSSPGQPLSVTCNPMFSSPVFRCSRVSVVTTNVDANGFSDADGKATCGGYSASCKALWGTASAVCRGSVAAPNVNPPLTCSITLWNHYNVNSASASCYNK